MKQRQDNSAAWAEIHAAARKEFPDPMNDPNRTKKGRAWFGRGSGMMPPSTPETWAACEAVFEGIKRDQAKRARESANLERHANDKARRHKQITADTNAKHAQETERRYHRQQAKVKDPNRFDMLFFVLAVAFVFGCIWLAPILGGVK